MKARGGIRLGLGAALCVVGFVLAKGTSAYRETTVSFDAGGCHLVTDIIDKGQDETQGSVVLLHGLSANKKIMEQLASAFAEQNLRVFVPDLPGHGRTAGPFSFARAESCAESLVRELVARKVIEAQRTVLAGHSMGGAIAIRVGARVSVSAVIAISPAPMRVAHGVPADMLPYTNPPALPSHTMAMSAAFEPLGIRELTREMVAEDAGGTSAYLLIPRATHVSVLFDARVMRAAQNWAAKTLGLALSPTSVPSSAPVVGATLGLAGILLLAGPFVREAVGAHHRLAENVPPQSTKVNDLAAGFSILRSLIEVALAALFAVIVLRFWNPLSFVRMYNGGYFASFLLITGLGLLLVHRKTRLQLGRAPMATVLSAAFAALVLHLLVTGWSDATLMESWVSAGRWARFPVFLVAAFSYLLGEEILLGENGTRTGWMQLLAALALRLIAFLVIVFGIFVLHSGAVMLILLALFFAVFFVLQRMGMDLVRRETGSVLAAAVFGAILLAGFSLVIFPVT